jgi:hypothetical protein
MIRSNTFGPLAESAPKGTPKVLIEKSNDVQIMNNKGISAEETTVRDLGNALKADELMRRLNEAETSIKEHPETTKAVQK